MYINIQDKSKGASSDETQVQRQCHSEASVRV